MKILEMKNPPVFTLRRDRHANAEVGVVFRIPEAFTQGCVHPKASGYAILTKNSTCVGCIFREVDDCKDFLECYATDRADGVEVSLNPCTQTGELL